MVTGLPNRSEVKAVVFDKDGVLADSESINLQSAFETFRAHGYDLGPDDEPAIVGKHPIDYVPVLAQRFRMSKAEQRRVIDEQDRIRGRFNLTYEASPALTLDLRIDYEDQDSETRESFDVLAYKLGLSYQFLGPR